MKRFAEREKIIVSESQECPFGWIQILDECIKLHPNRKTPENAQLACERDSSTLLNVMTDGDFNEALLKTIIKILEELLEDGLHESKWLIAPLKLNSFRGVSQRVWKRKHSESQHYAYVVLSRTVNVTYTLDVAASFLEYSYICSLEAPMRQKLLYQTSFMPKGVPELIVQPESEYYCRNDMLNMYINLPCKAIGNPSANIEWFRNGVEKIDTLKDNTSLVINGGTLMIPCGGGGTKKRSRYFASYHCTASNKYGSIRSTTTVVRPTFIEHFNPQRLDVFPFGYTGGARIECQAPVHYPKSYSYTWMIGGSTEKFVTIDQRTFISHDGTLYFSYNIPKDATSYACSLALETIHGGHYGPFFNLRLPESINEKSFAPRIDDLQPQVFPDHPRVGDTVYIECFAYGRPAADYRWNRLNDAKFSVRTKFTNFNRVLVITNVRAEDAGTYKCTVENEVGSDSAEVILNINSPPKIIWSLKDSVLPTNSTARFECQSNSKEANVEWFKNGVPIAPLLMSPEDRGRYFVRESLLAIRNTRESDSAMYQCIVSNEVGTATSSARLTVKDIAPQFAVKLMPKKRFVVVGSDLVVPCIFYSLPMGTVEWFDKFGKKVGSIGRRRHLDDAQNRLQIDEVVLHDEGIYVCRVSNRVGTSNYEIKINVLRKPIASANPLGVSVSPGDNNVTLTCELETLCDDLKDCPDTSFVWSSNSVLISSLPQYQHVAPSVVEELRTVDMNQYVKSKLRSELKLPKQLGFYRFGQFACSSPFGGGAMEVMPKNILSPPLLSVSNVSSTSITLTWSNQSDLQQIPISNSLFKRIFQLDLRTRTNKYWRPVSNYSEAITSTGENLLLLHELKAAEKFQFRVSPQQSFGVLDSSAETKWIATAQKAKKSLDLRIQYVKLDSKHILISWNPFQSLNGLQVWYRISWYSAYAESSVVVAEHSYVISTADDIADCYELSLIVEVLNNKNLTVAVDRLKAFVSLEAPTRVATQLAFSRITSTNAYLTWQWSKISVCENVYTTQVSCQPSPTDTLRLEYYLSPNSTSLLLKDLKPKTDYYCAVRAYDYQKRPGNLSEIIHFVTKIKAPAVKPEINKWTVQKQDGAYITTLFWSAVELRNGSISGLHNCGYNIRIYVTETASRPVLLRVSEKMLHNAQYPSTSIEGLKLLYYYIVQVSAYNDGGEGPLSDPYPLRIDTHCEETINSSTQSQFHNFPLFSMFFCLFMKFYICAK